MSILRRERNIRLMNKEQTSEEVRRLRFPDIGANVGAFCEILTSKRGVCSPGAGGATSIGRGSS